MRFTTDRSCTGRMAICSCVTTPPTSVLVVSTTGASPVTVTDSCSVWTPIEMSFGYSRPMVRTIFFTSTVAETLEFGLDVVAAWLAGLATRYLPSRFSNGACNASVVRVGDASPSHAGQHAALRVGDGPSDGAAGVLGHRGPRADEREDHDEYPEPSDPWHRFLLRNKRMVDLAGLTRPALHYRESRRKMHYGRPLTLSGTGMMTYGL